MTSQSQAVDLVVDLGASEPANGASICIASSRVNLSRLFLPVMFWHSRQTLTTEALMSQLKRGRFHFLDRRGADGTRLRPRRNRLRLPSLCFAPSQSSALAPTHRVCASGSSMFLMTLTGRSTRYKLAVVQQGAGIWRYSQTHCYSWHCWSRSWRYRSASRAVGGTAWHNQEAARCTTPKECHHLISVGLLVCDAMLPSVQCGPHSDDV